MNSRLQSLIERGYPQEDVLRLSSFTEEELDAACKAAFKHISRTSTSVSNPKALFVGGHPGCGKSSMSLNIKNNKGNIIEIGIDNYRMYHPKYIEIEKYIKKHWEGKTETINDSQGNDMVDMTQLFVGKMTDKLTELASKEKYNLLLEWGMRDPVMPLKTMEQLKSKGYIVEVLFVAANKDHSYAACNSRNNILTSFSHITRNIPKSFFDLCVESLPRSIDIIYTEGKNNNLFDYFSIVDRNGKILWKENDAITPGLLYDRLLYNLEEKTN